LGLRNPAKIATKTYGPHGGRMEKQNGKKDKLDLDVGPVGDGDGSRVRL
jgi:hypothetical protein